MLRFGALCAAICRDDVPKVANYVEVTVPQYLPDDFKTFFLMTRGTFERVMERISTDDQLRRRIAKGDREQVPLDKDLLMTLCRQVEERWKTIVAAYHRAKDSNRALKGGFTLHKLANMRRTGVGKPRPLLDQEMLDLFRGRN
ncbi:hypothetical protein DPMN_141820 [Dreissena polymorpha]|uniref:Uncharacterized protein n=1 Tax=Dreissena polymorpha TaxID=45954 RepID=A0A9D4JK96_DREPO|nr:hypothetical protein DPMN_141820 [Dreissena polymorpha]